MTVLAIRHQREKISFEGWIKCGKVGMSFGEDRNRNLFKAVFAAIRELMAQLEPGKKHPFGFAPWERK
ncbi:MAG: hypothetical protein ACYCY7_08375 [Gallionella sp.]